MEILTECRCCLTTGIHKNLKGSCLWLNKNVIYYDMLKECFNIMLSLEHTSNSICDTCIHALRSSYSFKQQVLRTEQELLSRVKKNGNNSCPVKLEVKQDSYDESDDMFLADAEHETTIDDTKTEEKDPLQYKQMKQLVEKGSKPRSTTKNLSKLEGSWRLKNIKSSMMGIDTITQEIPLGDIKKETKDTLIDHQETKGRSKPKSTIKSQIKSEGIWHKKMRNLVTEITTINSDDDVTEVKGRRDTKTQQIKIGPISKINLMWTKITHDKTKHRENLQTILKYSNATPFKNKSLLGYICGYCEATFPDPTDLRDHTVKAHEKERLDFKATFAMTDYNVNLDVVNLICTLCDNKMENLSILKEHLVRIHNKTIYSDIKDHIVQFKLKKGEVYDCVMCTSTYETFKMLKQHMNQHYRNYGCGKCGAAFATKRSLNSHKSTHQEGSFKCDHCEKVFSSKTKKTYHEKMKHMGARNISNCPHCDEPFRSYYQRNQHLVKVHNNEAQYKCNICSKAYILKSLLMYHIKKNHLMEKNCQCSECGHQFFSKKALKAHMIKHNGERIYACEVCNKSYARKNTLKEHMRIHNNDRRFKCDVCGLTFVQKCSLKSHLLSNHGISMAAKEIGFL